MACVTRISFRHRRQTFEAQARHSKKSGPATPESCRPCMPGVGTWSLRLPRKLYCLLRARSRCKYRNKRRIREVVRPGLSVAAAIALPFRLPSTPCRLLKSIEGIRAHSLPENEAEHGAWQG